jgi:hypothetical protein
MSNRHDDQSSVIRLRLDQMHDGQIKAFHALQMARRKILRAGRRFGKTLLARNWISQGLIQGQNVAWFAPQNRTWAEIYTEISQNLKPIISRQSKSAGVIRTITGGRLDFWTLENAIGGRGRGYERIVLDEAAFAKDGDNKTDGSAMAIFETAIVPTLYDHSGEILVCSNSAGKKSGNFFYNICMDPKYGFTEYHATTADNPILPLRLPEESTETWEERRIQELTNLVRDNDPLVYAQEYRAEFVDWSGVAFFQPDKWMVNGTPVSLPNRCQAVFAIIDTAIKTGYENDGTAVIYFAIDKLRPAGQGKLIVLDWDILKIEGASLEVWLPGVNSLLDHYAKICQARSGSLGSFIEDKGSGTVLLQQARNRGMRAQAIESGLTAMGKDERALNASPHHYQGEVKITDVALNKVMTYNRQTLNHFTEQVTSFRMADKQANKREDDLLDCYVYGIAIALGNSDGF